MGDDELGGVTLTHHFGECRCGQTTPLVPSTSLVDDPVKNKTNLSLHVAAHPINLINYSFSYYHYTVSSYLYIPYLH